jgi:hypothetical protein
VSWSGERLLVTTYAPLGIGSVSVVPAPLPRVFDIANQRYMGYFAAFAFLVAAPLRPGPAIQQFYLKIKRALTGAAIP